MTNPSLNQPYIQKPLEHLGALIMHTIWRISLIGLLSIYFFFGPLMPGGSAIASGNPALNQPAPGQSRYLIIPDYIDHKISIQLLYPVPRNFSFTISDCNPNSVAFNNNDDNLYVACNGDGGNGDLIGNSWI